eukprot:1547646-Rhodomonas_salina.4
MKSRDTQIVNTWYKLAEGRGVYANAMIFVLFFTPFVVLEQYIFCTKYSHPTWYDREPARIGPVQILHLNHSLLRIWYYAKNYWSLCCYPQIVPEIHELDLPWSGTRVPGYVSDLWLAAAYPGWSEELEASVKNSKGFLLFWFSSSLFSPALFQVVKPDTIQDGLFTSLGLQLQVQAFRANVLVLAQVVGIPTTTTVGAAATLQQCNFKRTVTRT